MALPAVDSAAYPTRQELLDAILRTLVLAYQRRGLTANVLPGSDHYIRHDAIARRLAVAYANLEVVLPTLSPTDAVDDYLTDLCAVFGVTARDASAAAGEVEVSVSGGASVTIPEGYVLTAPSGAKYATTSTTVGVEDGDTVEVQATTTGAETNLDAETACTWDSASVGFLSPTCVVDAGGLTGGADQDTEEVLRQRLFDRLSFPQGGGNVAQTKTWAEEATAAVEAAYVYAAVRGPGSVDVAVTSSSASDRAVSETHTATVLAYLEGKLPGHASVNVTTVEEQGVDVLLVVDLPYPSSVGGAGGGWRDAVPFPTGTPSMGTNDGKVTAYGAPTATIRSTTAPIVGQHIAFWNPTGGDDGFGSFIEYTIATVGGVSGAYTITVNGGFSVSPLGSYVSAGAERLVDYGATFLASMRALGPGEKTSDTSILPRGRRQLGVDIGAPSKLSTEQIKDLETEYTEVLDVSYGARVDTGTTTTRTAPSLPASTTAAPKILTLKQLAIRVAT